MKPLACLLLFLLTACTVPIEPSAQSDIEVLPPANIRQTKTVNQGIRDYRRIAGQVEPVAERICREQRPNAPRLACDFKIVIDDQDRSGPNAYQTLSKAGQPIIAFNIPMLITIENDDELGFILGHEAAHQIAGHISKAQLNAGLGATLLGTLATLGGASNTAVQEANRLGGAIGARAYSQEHEFEADSIGTYIAHAAGFDPVRGAKSFARFQGGGGFLATHPPSSQRYNRVLATMRQIQQSVPLSVN